jgi:hypothetical protein
VQASGDEDQPGETFQYVDHAPSATLSGDAGSARLHVETAEWRFDECPVEVRSSAI